METIYEEFVAGGKADLRAWDCEAMYPEPKKIDFGPSWLGGVTKAAVKAFDVYNLVKKFIPESKAGSGKVPGSPKLEELYLEELMFGGKGSPKFSISDEDKEKAKELGKKLLDDLVKEEKEGSKNLAARKRIWREAVGMCNDDRDAYIAKLKATQKTIEKMTEPVKLSESLKAFSIGKGLAKYSSSVSSIDMGDSTPDERATNKVNLTQFAQDVKDGLEESATNQKAAAALKAALIK
jgi:hypothetical protein